MTVTDKTVAKTLFDVAAEMAKTLGMTPEEDMTKLRKDQRVMMVTSSGIVVGKIRVAVQEKKTVRYESYLLMDTITPPQSFSEVRLCKYMFWADGQGEPFKGPDIACSLPEGASLYVQ